MQLVFYYFCASHDGAHPLKEVPKKQVGQLVSEYPRNKLAAPCEELTKEQQWNIQIEASQSTNINLCNRQSTTVCVPTGGLCTRDATCRLINKFASIQQLSSDHGADKAESKSGASFCTNADGDSGARSDKIISEIASCISSKQRRGTYCRKQCRRKLSLLISLLLWNM